jgi:DNA invertase Pin-like site-specific DNA recombinase
MLRLGEIDGVAFWSLDRWGRSMSELVLELEEFSATGKALVSLKEGFDLSNASGRLMANLLAAMANFERDMIRERVMAGLARAKAQGKKLGRPFSIKKIIKDNQICMDILAEQTPPANPTTLTEEKLEKK